MPNLFDHLLSRADQEPQSTAIQGVDRSVTFGQLLENARSIAGKLRRAGVRPGQLVVSSIRGKDLDWMVTLALFHEGVVSCSEHGLAPLPPSLAPDWVITDRPGFGPAGRTILADAAWLDAAGHEYESIEPHVYESDDSRVRMFLTSGTTGRKKAVALTLGQLLGRARISLAHRGCRTTLGMLTLTTAGDFNGAVTSLLTGVPVYISRPGREVIDMVRRYSIEGIHASPAQLAGVVDELTKTNERLDSVKVVRLVGATPTAVLLERIRSCLTANVLCLYGSTEAGSMCFVKPGANVEAGAVGQPHGEAEIQVVDAPGHMLPQGEVGAVRVRTPYMASEYFNDPQESARSFRDGWFYPGDRGRLNAEGMLVLTGRDSETINAGGVKIDPLPIDRELLDYPGVQDAAVFMVVDDAGRERVGAAVVAASGFNVETLRQAMREKVGPARAPVVFLLVRAIPRNEMGKIMRAALREDFLRSVSAGKGSPGSAAPRRQ